MTVTPERLATSWDYAPAPEATDHIRLADRYELFLGGRWEAPADGVYVPTTNPATEEPLAEVARAGAADVDRAVAAARAALPAWRALPALERGKYVFRIARLIQERARELAIVETLDGGKPIRESRDVDVPARRGALLLLRGLGGQARLRRRRPRGRADGRRRPDRAVELPAADGRVEARAGARLRQHRGAQAGRDDAADRAAARRDHPGGRAARGRREHPHRATAPPARRSCATRTSTRSPSPARPRSARTSRPRSRAATSASRSSSAASRRTSSSTTPRSTRPSRASSTGSSSTRATSAAPARACCCRRASPTR